IWSMAASDRPSINPIMMTETCRRENVTSPPPETACATTRSSPTIDEAALKKIDAAKSSAFLATPPCSSGRQTMGLEGLAERHFLKFASGRMGQFRDEDHIVRHRPGRKLPLQEFDQDLAAGLASRLRHDDEQRPLSPARMRQADGSSFRHMLV